MANKLYTDIYNLISQHDRILIMPSSPPDGDSLGSALALYLLLKKMGKEVTVVCADPVPESYKFLPTSNVISNKFAASSDFIVTLDCSRAQIEDIKTKIENDKVNIVITPKHGNLSERGVSFSYGATNYELIIVVDAGDLQQLGRFYEDNTDLFTRIPVINIDHHTSNAQYGKINLVDIMAPSTTEVIMYLIESFPNGKELLDEDIATLLLAGIITDTGSFQNSNTTPRAFAAASHLLGYGARQQEIVQHVYKTKNLSTLKLWGRVLSKIKTDEEHKLVWSTISQKDLADTDSHQEETGDIIDELMTNAPGAEVVMLIKEKEEGLVSVSVRTTHAGVDASALAEMFGGGGHTQAAGFRVKGKDVKAAEEEIIKKVREFQAKRLFLPPSGELDDAASGFAEILPTDSAAPSAPGGGLGDATLGGVDGLPADSVDVVQEPAADDTILGVNDLLPNTEVQAESVPDLNSMPEAAMTEEPLMAADTSSEPQTVEQPVEKTEEMKEMTKKFFEPEPTQAVDEQPVADTPVADPSSAQDDFDNWMPGETPPPEVNVEQIPPAVMPEPTFEIPEAPNATPALEKTDDQGEGLQFDLNPGQDGQSQ